MADGKVGRPKGLPKYGGRAKGSPNKATSAARAAIAEFVEGNAVRLQEWLDQVAAGVWSDELGDYVVRPDPEKAFSMFQSVIEYHVPKLARTELVGDAEKPLVIGRLERVIIDPNQQTIIEHSETKTLEQYDNIANTATALGAPVQQVREI